MIASVSRSTARAGLLLKTLLGAIFIFPTIYTDLAMSAEAATITVNAWYRERILVPPESRVHVSLQDVSRMDVPARIIAETDVKAVSGPPWEISLAYDPGELDDRGNYVVRAWIDLDTRLLFTTDTVIPAYGGSGSVDALMVRVSGAAENKDLNPADSLAENEWILSELGGESVDPGTGPQQISLQFDPSNGSISGSSGCNRFNGSYQVDGDRLSFGQMLSTMMACVEGMELEQQILQSLAQVKSFRIEGNQLMLLDDSGEVILHYRTG